MGILYDTYIIALLWKKFQIQKNKNTNWFLLGKLNNNNTIEYVENSD